jgi:Ca2+-transporting ATPase
MSSVESSWHAMAVEEVLRRLEVDAKVGLPNAVAAKRLSESGLNALPEVPPTPFWKLFLGQLRGALVLILIAAVAVSMAVGDWIEAGVILAIVLLNAFVAALQEQRADVALQALKKMAAPEAQVLRDGELTALPARELVPGDVVALEAGSIVPADLRLVEGERLQVDEASLTGESVPASKQASASLEVETVVADRVNSVFMGTTVSYGRGRGVVVATGLATELGRIAKAIEAPEEATPLQRRLQVFGKLLGTAVLVICGLVFLLGIIRDPNVGILFRDGLGAYLETSREMVLGLFIVAVSLAVAAVPEGLPAVVTMSLALGMREMLHRHALVRRLPSVETLGSATVICTDKTGTLTENQMTVTRIWASGRMYTVTGQGYIPEGEIRSEDERVELNDHPVLRQTLWAGLWCNNAQLVQEDAYRIVGDPTEGALVVAARKLGLARLEEGFSRVAEIPFDSERKRMTTVHQNDGETPFTFESDHYIALVKGAPDAVLGQCAGIQTLDGLRTLNGSERRTVEEINERLALQGLRVLAVAYRELADVPEEPTAEDVERELVFLGLFAMQDPPRVEVPSAVRKARQAGLRTIMITGDHVATATSIGEQVDILQAEGSVLTGEDLDRMSDQGLADVIDRIDVFARVSPHHKVRIVDALQGVGHVVAMTGDGVNDAPALKRADIGIAMGITGTDVAKQTADMVLTDDNYASIVAAVEQGRVIYTNIRKTILYLLSCNFAEIGIIFFAILFGWASPLTAIQLLWLNLLTDGAPALALGVERGEPGIMARPPRSPKGRIVNRKMAVGILFQSSFLTAVVLGAYALALGGRWAPIAGTIAFATLVVAELARAYTARSEEVPLVHLKPFSNRWMQLATLSSFLLILLVLYVPPLQSVFRTAALDWRMWVVILPMGMAPAAAVELRKLWRSRRHALL